MSELTNRIYEDWKNAVKSKKELEKRTLSSLRAVIQSCEKDKKRELADDEVVSILRKESNKRFDAEVAYISALSFDRATLEKNEREVIDGYIPEQASEAEINAVVTSIAYQNNLNNPKSLGLLIKLTKEYFGNRSDGKTISTAVKSYLEKV